MPETILEVNNLVKTYDDEKAVDGISFSVGAREIVGLLGPNGAGKTTTINMILGLIEPTEGLVRIFGKEITRYRSEILSKVNFSASYAPLPFNMSPRQNLLISAMLYDVPLPQKRIETLLREYDLETLADRRTGFLSSGEQSRLSMAKALLNEPKLLVLDEPTASLDPSSAEIVRGKIKEYVKVKRDAGILWTSHNMYEIEAICDRVLFISHGKILLEGKPLELPAQYGKKNLEELFIAVAREPLSLQ